jgi:hypothetical protein
MPTRSRPREPHIGPSVRFPGAGNRTPVRMSASGGGGTLVETA